MDNVDVALDSPPRVDADSKQAGETGNGGILTGYLPSQIGLTGRFERALLNDGPTGHVAGDIAALRDDVNWMLSFLFFFGVALFLLLVIR